MKRVHFPHHFEGHEISLWSVFCQLCAYAVFGRGGWWWFYLKWTNLMKNMHLIMSSMQSGELRSSTFGGQQMHFIKFAFTLRADCPERVAQNSLVWTFVVFWGWSVPMGLFASADHKVWQGPGPYEMMPQSLNRLWALLKLSWRRHVCTTTSRTQ